MGWSTSPTATIAEYQPGEEYKVDKNIVLYAVWKVSSSVESYSCANGSIGSEPYAVTYTGDCTVIDDGDGNWRLKFLTSGEFISKIDLTIDAFLVGGGGGGSAGSGGSGGSGGGAPGGTISTGNSAKNNTGGGGTSVRNGGGGAGGSGIVVIRNKR